MTMKEIDDWVEEWHSSPDGSGSLDDWLAEHLGWSKEESIHWCETNEEPGIVWDGTETRLEKLLIWWVVKLTWEHSPNCEDLSLHCCVGVRKHNSQSSVESVTHCYFPDTEPFPLYFREHPDADSQEVEVGDKFVYRGEGVFKLVKHAES